MVKLIQQIVIPFQLTTRLALSTMALLVGLVTLTSVILLDSMKQFFVPLLISGVILLCFKILL